MPRRRAWIILALLALPWVAVAALWLYRSAVLSWALPRIAADMGIQDPVARVESFRWGKVVLADVGAGAGTLRIDRVGIQFSPAGLRHGRLGSVEVQGLRVDVHMGERGISIAPLDAWLAEEPDVPPREPPLRVRELRLLDARINLSTGTDLYEIELKGDVSFAPEGPYLNVRGPLLVRVENGPMDFEALGRVRVRGSLDYSSGDPVPELRIDVDRFAAGLADFVVEGVEGALHVRGLPPATPTPQRFSIERIASGAELTQGAVAFRLDADGRWHLDEARFDVFGGVLRVTGMFDPSAERNRFQASVRGIDLAALLAEVEVPGLAGTGRIGGKVVLDAGSDDLRIEDGEMTSKGGGWIHYRPPGQGPLDYENPQGLDLVRTALDNFEYRSLGGRLSGDAGGELLLALRIEGANPDLYDAHPIKLDLNLNGPFMGLLRSSRTVTGIPESIERRIKEGR